MFEIYAAPPDRHYCMHLAGKLPKFRQHRENWYPDDEAKIALMKVSHSVVALVSYIGMKEITYHILFFYHHPLNSLNKALHFQ